MRLERALGILILAELVLAVLGIAAEAALDSLGASAAVRPASAVLTALWVAAVVGTVLSWVGLLYLRRGARLLYLASWVAYLFWTLLKGVASTAAEQVLQMTMALVGGAILGLVYFSPLRTRFR